MELLPYDTLVSVCCFVEIEDLFSIFTTCKYLSVLAKDEQLFHILYKNRFGWSEKCPDWPSWKSYFIWRWTFCKDINVDFEKTQRRDLLQVSKPDPNTIILKFISECVRSFFRETPVGSCQLNSPQTKDTVFKLGPKAESVAYFELTVLNKGKTGSLGIGWGSENWGKTWKGRMPGWNEGSWGYHGDDGRIFEANKYRIWGPTWNDGDVIGAGYNFDRDILFFTKNGLYLGDAFKGRKLGKIYPIVGLHSINEEVSINVGQKPFVFDLIAYAENRVILSSEPTAPPDYHIDTLMDNETPKPWLGEGGIGYVETTDKQILDDMTCNQ